MKAESVELEKRWSPEIPGRQAVGELQKEGKGVTDHSQGPSVCDLLKRLAFHQHRERRHEQQACGEVWCSRHSTVTAKISSVQCDDLQATPPVVCVAISLSTDYDITWRTAAEFNTTTDQLTASYSLGLIGLSTPTLSLLQM